MASDLNLEIDPNFVSVLQRGKTENRGGLPAGLKRVITKKVTWNPGTVNPGSETGTTFPMPGIVPGDPVVLGIPATTMNSIVMIFQAWVFAVDTIAIRCFNITGSALDPAQGEFTFSVLKV